MFSTAPTLPDRDSIWMRVLEGTSGETGRAFFLSLVKNLALALDVHAAWVTEYFEKTGRMQARAFWLGQDFLEHYEYELEGTPCHPSILKRELVHFPERLVELFPKDPDLRKQGGVSYMGVPLFDTDGSILGHLAIMDTKPMPRSPDRVALFRIFAVRASAEMQRLRAEAQLRLREQQLSGLFDSAMDAILQLDEDLRICLCNTAALRLLGKGETLDGRSLHQYLSRGDMEKLSRLLQEIELRPPGNRHLWIPGGFELQGNQAPRVEATLSRFQDERRVYHTLILRDIRERIEAERRIEDLTQVTDYLREEILALHNEGELIGRSPAMMQVLAEVSRVAPTQSTVLILGETGTGKELIARALHRSSPRSARPLIKVNCAAMPTNLIESELFGHERGAFTGATSARKGRFALADGGTLFLDEIGEMPLELQPKLLRVLQEGEFEPVGSSRTQKVDVRVVAATHRNLECEVTAGRFREDLYYRLNVFPIRLPALRDRPEDIPTLAQHFAFRFAKQAGRVIEPLGESQKALLRAYSWPGNVRELQNLVERAVILSLDGRLNLHDCLPDRSGATGSYRQSHRLPNTAASPAEENTGAEATPIRTAAEMLEMEKANLRHALEACNGKVAGEEGAARLLGMPPSTLSSRLKALGIRKS